MFEIIQREFIYIGYYFMVQLRQIFFYWVLGMVIGSLVSVFAKDAIHSLFGGLKDKKMGIWGVIPASLLGIASPLMHVRDDSHCRLFFPAGHAG